VDRILSLSSFPSILLITTLFRLALSISTSRLILLNADAGHIVSTFGDYVIGDSLVVGFVIFLIITIVQFIVITKGSERVAEVAARFSLDGMPGKQMSIDADLRAGIIDSATAQAKRTVVEKESQLYGSFDGAMKFIKGDAIAGIIIIFVNFIGGISVGMVQHGTSFSDALHIYTILTIGDGLVAQIPALLISISAGFVVTRVSGEGNNLGHSIVTQLFDKSFVILVTAVLVLAMGMLPGFPTAVFVVLSASLFAFYWYKQKKGKTAEAAGGTSAEPGSSPDQKPCR
jgi:type III secretion protein V